MKKTFLLILILLGLCQMARAQGYVLFTPPQGPPFQFSPPGWPLQWSPTTLWPPQPPPDFLYQPPYQLGLNLNFSPLPGTPGTNQPSGTGNYTYLYNQGNSFSISISLGTNQATDAWLLQSNSDGSFTPIMEFTNESWYYTVPSPFQYHPTPAGTNYYYTQTWELTTNQVQALVAGELYAEVSYDNDEYFGQFSRAYVRSPYPAITVWAASEFASPSLIVFPGGNATAAVISPASNKPARVTLDGSNSIDPFYLPLQFLWWAGPDPIADTATTTLNLTPGNYAFQLELTDGYSTNSAMAMVNVISPEEAIDELRSTLAQAGLSAEITRNLTSTLQFAQYLLQNGATYWGAQELIIFQNNVNAFSVRMDSSTAFGLYDGAADIIKAVGGRPVRYAHP